jgi:hypothetical protein
VAGVTAGCLGRAETTPCAPLVEAIRARNFHEEAHQMEVTLTHDGTQVHSSSHELPPARGRTWAEERADGP